jgi:hypothetical protein
MEITITRAQALFLASVDALSLAPGFSRVMRAPARENGFNRFQHGRTLKSAQAAAVIELGPKIGAKLRWN